MLLDLLLENIAAARHTAAAFDLAVDTAAADMAFDTAVDLAFDTAVDLAFDMAVDLAFDKAVDLVRARARPFEKERARPASLSLKHQPIYHVGSGPHYLVCFCQAGGRPEQLGASSAQAPLQRYCTPPPRRN